MTPQNIIDRLNNQSNFVDFCRELDAIYQQNPFTMTVNTYVISAIQESKWLQNVEDIFLRLQFYRDGKYIIDRGISSKLFSYIGNVINDEEFWFEVLRVQPDYARYWFKPTESFKSAVALLK